MALLKNQKSLISQKLKDYMTGTKVSQETLGKEIGINIAYVNAVCNGETKIGETTIKDTYYHAIADHIGVALEKDYWSHKDTPGYKYIITELMDGKANKTMKVIIDNTGYGKTYAVNRYVKEYRNGTYRITVSSLHKVKDIIREIGNAVGVTGISGEFRHLVAIKQRVRSLKMTNGYKVQIIIDESENLRSPALKMLKAAYDILSDYASIVLIGTDELIRNIEKLRDNPKEYGIKQFYRRFKAGVRIVPRMEKRQEFNPWLEELEDRNLRKLLLGLCDNIGELHDFLEPAIRMADQMNRPLDEEFFKYLHRI